MSAATWPRLCLLRHNLTQLTEFVTRRRAQFIAWRLFPAIITRPRRIGLERVRCRLSPWGNHAPQSDPRRRLGRPLTERRNGARLRQRARFAAAAGRNSPSRAKPSRLTAARRPAPSSSAPASGGSTSCSPIIRRSDTASASGGRASPGPGVTRIANKREWPDWTPPRADAQRAVPTCRATWKAASTIRSARGRCISAGTLYRIHGSNEPDTIGQAVSSGCIRMTNDDVIDLYEPGEGRRAGGRDALAVKI